VADEFLNVIIYTGFQLVIALGLAFGIRNVQSIVMLLYYDSTFTVQLGLHRILDVVQREKHRILSFFIPLIILLYFFSRSARRSSHDPAAAKKKKKKKKKSKGAERTKTYPTPLV
jgi:hypothetical protein